MDISAEILSQVHMRRGEPDDLILLSLWEAVNEPTLRASPLSRSEKLRHAREWVDARLVENKAAICALPLVADYCAGKEMTDAVVAAIAEFFAVKMGIQNGVSLGLVVFRQGLKRFCAFPAKKD